MSVGSIPLHNITTITSAASKTFKNANFRKCVIVYYTEDTERNGELVLKAKIEPNLFQQYFTPHTPPLKHGESETTHPQSRPPQHTHHTLNNSFP
jgi:hypothetical protein